MVRRYQRFLNCVQVSLDALFLLVAYGMALVCTFGWRGIHLCGEGYIRGAVWMVPLLLLVYYCMEAYSPMRSRRYRAEALILFKAHLVGVVIIYSILFLNRSVAFSREVSLVFASTGLGLLLMERFCIRKTLRYFRQKGFNQKHMLIIGAGAVGADFARKVMDHQDFGYTLVGFLDDDVSRHGTCHAGSPILAGCSFLPELLRERSLDEVVVALPPGAHMKYDFIVSTCEKAGVRIRIIPDCYTVFGAPQIEEFDGIPLLNARRIPLDDPFKRLMKRFLDMVVATLALTLTAPLMVMIGICVRISSPGPVFFRQERIGLNNRAFQMLKFRTMRVDGEAVAATTWTTADDPRKTPFGLFLRKTSLDELPQFWNVLLGHMSVIGPRPERPHFVDQFREAVPSYMVKHQVKPGITGWAQVNGWRGDTSIQKRIECDLYYIENWDLLLDIKIILLTIYKGLVHKNAY